MQDALINFAKYKEDSVINFQFIADRLSSDDTTAQLEVKPWQIIVSVFRINDSRLIYHDHHKEQLHDQIDYNHISISGLNIEFNDFILLGDSIHSMIKQISLREQSGFVLERFESDFTMSPAGMYNKGLIIETGNTKLALDLAFEYEGFSSFNDFLHEIKLNSLISESSIDLSDLGYFAPEMKLMKNEIVFSGSVKGSVDNLRVKDFNLDFGHSSHFYGDISMNGLPKIEETYVKAKIKDLYTNSLDIQTINIPGENGNTNNLEVDEIFNKFGDVKIRGYFTGFYNDFVAKVKLQSLLGNLATDMIIKQSDSLGLIQYNGRIEAEELNFGKLTGMEENFGNLNLNAEISGSGLSAEDIAVQINGTVDSLDFNNVNYSSILIKGDYRNETFTGSTKIIDEIINLDFLGVVDLSKDKPLFDFTSVIKNADLNRLELVSSDEKMILSTKLNISLTGLSIDSINGTLIIDSTYFSKGDKNINMERLILDVFNDTTGKKRVNVVSDFVDVNISGEFQIEDIIVSFDKFLEEYLSSVDIVSDSIKELYTDDQILSVDISLKNTLPVTELFLPQLKISPNTLITATYNSINGIFTLNGASNAIIYSGYELDNFFIKGMTGKKSILLQTGCERLWVSDSLGIDDFAINAKVYNDSIEYNLLWKNHDTVKNTADIAGFINFNNFPEIEGKFTRFETYFNDSLWTVHRDNHIIIDSTYLEVRTLDFSSKNQFIKINGIVSEDPAHSIHLEFKDFDISNFDLLLQNKEMDVDGYLNGKATLTNVYNSPDFFSDIIINDLALNKDMLGDAYIETNWNDLEKSLYLKANVIYKGNFGENNTFLLDGYYYQNDVENNFDVTLAINNFKLKTISGLFSGFSSDVGGMVTGNLSLKGTIDKPDVTGKIKFLRTYVKVDYLNTKYSFTDEITINNDNFTFSNMTLYDSLGNTAVVNGKITHDSFKDFVMDINIKTKNLSSLNTTYVQNDEFYGNVFFSGDVYLKGDLNDIAMDISGKTDRKTKFIIPLSSTSALSNNNYIIFVDHSDTISGEAETHSQVSGLSMNFNLNVTPDAAIEIIMPGQSGNIKANGDGYIRLVITPDGDFNIFGDYIVSKGSYLFTLQNVINKHFDIRSGGSIKWNGSPTDADISMRAVYSIKAPLSGLMLATDSTGAYSQRIVVDCILDLKGKLFNPEIKFSLELPGSDYETQQLVFSQIDTTDQGQMSEQMLFLLVLNQFKPVSGSDIAMYSSVGATSFDILTNQLNNWLSQISDDFDIGLNYQPGNDVTSEEIEIALSTQLFNDRVSIDGNFGVAGTDESKQTSNIVGDVNVEVKITEDGRFRVKAFNKTNSINSIEYNAPYTQGVGIFYRKEFENLRDLFGKNRKKMIN